MSSQTESDAELLATSETEIKTTFSVTNRKCNRISNRMKVVKNSNFNCAFSINHL